jgi:hypothetical protein
MSSLSVAEQDRAVREVVVAHLKREENISDDQIAEQLDYGSAETMHHQFRRWGFPDWLVSREPPELDQPKRRPRKPLGMQRELPPADAAVALFQERIEALRRAVEELPSLMEAAQGGRFVSTSIAHMPAWYRRNDYSEEEWRNLCQTQGQNPDEDMIPVPDSIITIQEPTRAGRVPPQPLVMLIGAYALADGDMEALLRALHPSPSEVDREKLSRLLQARKPVHGEDGLIRRAEQVATLVRGGKLGRGAPPPDIPELEYRVASDVTRYREQGLSEEQIYQKLAWTGFTTKKISDLGSLGLRELEE